jgi:hypothetical protein
VTNPIYISEIKRRLKELEEANKVKSKDAVKLEIE